MTMRSLLCAFLLLSSSLAPWGNPAAAAPAEPATARPAAISTGELRAGGALNSGDSLRSADGRYTLIMQTDGNAVVYQQSRVLWTSNTPGHPGARLIVQSDGNLVLYAATNRALWATNTYGAGAVLAMQNDGNLVLYHGPKAVWASGPDRFQPGRLLAGGTLGPGMSLRSVGGRYLLVMQTDGNAVVYQADRVLWSSKTQGHPGARLVVQQDGNLVLYASNNRALWATNTYGPNAALAMQQDGNLVLYHGSRAVWATAPDWLPQSNRSGLRTGERLVPGESLVSGLYYLSLRADGQLVGGGPWGLGVRFNEGRPAAQLVLQQDGNLVLYAADGTALWASSTRNTVRLDLDAQATLTLRDSGDRPSWTMRIAFAPVTRALSGQTQSRLTSLGMWQPGCPVPLSDLREIELDYFTFDNKPARGLVIVHKNVANDVVDIFGELYTRRFPIRSMIADIPDDDVSMAQDNTMAFNCRRITGGTSWSLHSYGTAIDINPVENPYVSGETVLPPAGAAYLDRSRVRPGMIVQGGPVVRAFESRGWRWGGRWTRPIDYQHFEK